MKDSEEGSLAGEFRYTGKWWLSSNPAIQIPGTLRFSQDDGAILELDGSFAEGPEINGICNPAIVNGISSDGKAITLHRCLGKHWTRSNDFVHGRAFETTTLHAHNVFVGVHFNSEEEIKFNHLRVRYSYLDAWLGISGFSFEDNRTEQLLRYRKPDSITVRIDDNLTLHIAFEASWSPYSVTEPRISQRAWLFIVPSRETSFGELIQIVHRIGVLLSLATGESIYPADIRGQTELAKVTRGDYTFYEDVGAFYQLASTPKQKLTVSFEPMLSYQTVANRFEYMLRNWFRKAEQLEPVYELYFVSVYGRQMYQAQKFLCLIQALESYHRRMVNNRELPKKDHNKRIEEIMRDVPSEYQDWLRGKLNYSNEPTLRRRLEELLNRFPTTVSSLIKGTQAFIFKVCDTRNYLTHYDPKLKNDVVKGEALYRITLQITALVEMCLLEELGFTLDEIHNCVYTKYGRYKILRENNLKENLDTPSP